MQPERKIANIILIGFMGTGKTSVGMQLAETLDMRFIDTDDIIEENSKMSIPEIFSEMGEEHFRDLESKAVEEVSRFSRYVVATGGGAVIREQNVRNLKSSGLLFCLDATPEVILQRTSQYAHRPLLQVENPISKIRNMLQFRAPFYAKADYRIDTSQLTVKQVADRIATISRSYLTTKGEENCSR
jgi:shikimate kinase